MSTEHSLRASDDDRDRLVEQLQRHAVAGRLSMDEYAERVDRVLGARTHGELAAVTHDLPAESTMEPSPRPPRGRAATDRRVPGSPAGFSGAWCGGCGVPLTAGG